MKITVIGTGYVGLVQGIILADFGLDVICMDTDENKIQKLKMGEVPIYEPGLKELLHKVIKSQKVKFTTDIKKSIQESKVIFIAVGTPAQDDGSADLKHVFSVARSLGEHINSYKVIVNKSTVPVGTGRIVRKTIQSELVKRGANIDFDVVSNPEFLREGKAISDCIRPDRIVIGSHTSKAKEIMRQVYNVFYLNKTPFVFTDLESAEMIKYASNAFLAVKISFINEMALLAEKVGANVQKIATAMGMDGRISPKFLHAGPGYGGSCFPKDTKAIVDIAKKNDEQLLIVEAAIKANEKQKNRMVKKIHDEMGTLTGKTIAILGLTFKPETDDMRDAPSITIIKGLVKLGAKIKVFCPQGQKEALWRLKEIENSLEYSQNEYSAVQNANATVILTEWNQFRGMDLKRVKSLMRDDLFFDFRNIYENVKSVRELFRYFCVGQSKK